MSEMTEPSQQASDYPVIERNDRHWTHFTYLEADLRGLSRFIELDEANLQVFSYECARLFLAAAAEAEVVAKLIANQDGSDGALQVKEYRAAVMARHPEIAGASVSLLTLTTPIIPWKSWADDNSPDWWKAYNEVKHARAESFAQANLSNLLHAMAGLLVLLIVYLRRKGVQFVLPPPALLVPGTGMGDFDVMTIGPAFNLM